MRRMAEQGCAAGAMVATGERYSCGSISMPLVSGTRLTVLAYACRVYVRASVL